MKEILLIDADSKIPNIPLMKISAYHKSRGDHIEFHKYNLPYYPNKKKQKHIVSNKYYRIYCSIVFSGNKDFIIGENIIFGGTGIDLTTILPREIDMCELDYSLYPDNDCSYGFISRGCIRKCDFCVVPKKEGKIHQVSTIDEIVQHKKVKFLDNNFLALPNHKNLLQELIDKKISCQFNQGLDIRLIDKENSVLLEKLNYLGEYVFAFDSYTQIKNINKKLELLEWRKPYQFKFFVYVNPNMELSGIVNRIEHLKKIKCLPYIMRDISCWNSKHGDFYIDIAAYCNQPNIIKKMDFDTFLLKRYRNKNRIITSSNLYYLNSRL